MLSRWRQSTPAAPAPRDLDDAPLQHFDDVGVAGPGKEVGLRRRPGGDLDDDQAVAEVGLSGQEHPRERPASQLAVQSVRADRVAPEDRGQPRHRRGPGRVPCPGRAFTPQIEALLAAGELRRPPTVHAPPRRRPGATWWRIPAVPDIQSTAGPTRTRPSPRPPPPSWRDPSPGVARDSFDTSRSAPSVLESDTGEISNKLLYQRRTGVTRGNAPD